MSQPAIAPKKLSLDLAVLFLLALLIRWLAALPQQQPNYMDAAYYYVNALNLFQGRGFVEDFIWIYLDNPASVSHPSHLYWMPFTSILAWLGMVVGGQTYRAAQLFFVVLSALLVPITYGVTCIIFPRRWYCWLAAIFVIFAGFYFPFFTAIDNFTPFAVAGSLALLTAWAALATESGKLAKLYPVLAGILVGLAHLSRADGLLLLIAIILTVLIQHLVAKDRGLRPMQSVLRFAFFLLLGYFTILTPWFVRNWQVVGTPFPTSGSQSIWLTAYDDLFSYGRELSPRTFFAQGIGPILRGRWWVLTTNLQTVLAVWGMIFLLPLAVLGFWVRRRHRLIQLAALYALLLFGVMTLVFAFPGARGGLFHSGAALLPYIYATAVVGLDKSIDWLAARRRGWKARSAKQFFAVGLVVMAIFLSGFIYYQRVLKSNTWNSADRAYATVAGWVAMQNPAAIVMINNPPAYRYHGGGLSVVVPNEDVATTLRVADRYQVDYLVLGPNDPALAAIYHQTLAHPRLRLVNTVDDIKIFKIATP
jgi:hypothetical protein